LAQTADLALVTLAGREWAVPATKKFTTQLVAMAVLATALARDPIALALVVAGQLVLRAWPGRSVCTPTHPAGSTRSPRPTPVKHHSSDETGPVSQTAERDRCGFGARQQELDTNFRSPAFDRAKKEVALVISSGANIKAMQLMLDRESAAMTWTR